MSLLKFLLVGLCLNLVHQHFKVGQCMTPFIVLQKDQGRNIPVPCGKCPACVARRVSQWSFRLMQEERVSSSSHFITLTYDCKHAPISQNGFLSLDKRHVQAFFKRLRWSQDQLGIKERIKYYAVGEYGGKTKRPHYHAIIFNARIECIQPAWSMGHVYYGDVSGASVGYTLKYMSKTWRPMHRNDDREWPQALMSKGLGKAYLSEAMREWHESDMYNRMYCSLLDGRKIGMPRYYKDKLYTKEQREHIGAVTLARMLDRQYAEIEKAGPSYYRDLAEAQKAAFERMHLKAVENDKL